MSARETVARFRDGILRFLSVRRGGLAGVFVFDLPGTSWTLDLDAPTPTLTEGKPAGKPTSTLTVGAAELAALVAQPPAVAELKSALGRLVVAGALPVELVLLFLEARAPSLLRSGTRAEGEFKVEVRELLDDDMPVSFHRP